MVSSREISASMASPSPCPVGGQESGADRLEEDQEGTGDRGERRTVALTERCFDRVDPAVTQGVVRDEQGEERGEVVERVADRGGGDQQQPRRDRAPRQSSPTLRCAIPEGMRFVDDEQALAREIGDEWLARQHVVG